MTRRIPPAVGVLAVLIAIAVCAAGVLAVTQDRSVHVRTHVVSGPQPPLPASARASAGATARVVVLVEENHESSRILGSRSAPFLNSLATSGTQLSSYYGIRHPSLPNYLALLGGDTFGIRSDCTGCRVHATNLVEQLEAAGISWRGYFQGLPHPCSNAASSGSYAKKHNPFMYFDDVRRDPARCRNVVPFDQFGRDLAAGPLPRFVFIVPDQQHDMHDGSVAKGDRWAREVFGRLTSSPAWREDTRFVLTFDEGDSKSGCCAGFAAGGRVATFVVGPRVAAGVSDGTAYDHYSLLASIESFFGLDRLGYAAHSSSHVIGALR